MLNTCAIHLKRPVIWLPHYAHARQYLKRKFSELCVQISPTVYLEEQEVFNSFSFNLAERAIFCFYRVESSKNLNWNCQTLKCMHDIDCYSFDMTLTKMHHSSHCFQNTIEPYKPINKYYILKKVDPVFIYLLVYMVLQYKKNSCSYNAFYWQPVTIITFYNIIPR